MARKYLLFAWDFFWGGSPESVEPIPPSSRHPQPIQPRQPLSNAVDQDNRDLGVLLTSEYRVARPTWLSARYRVFYVVGLHVRQASLILPTYYCNIQYLPWYTVLGHRLSRDSDLPPSSSRDYNCDWSQTHCLRSPLLFASEPAGKRLSWSGQRQTLSRVPIPSLLEGKKRKGMHLPP